MKVATVVGARPQFIKAAVVSRRLAEAGVDEQLIHTGQHYDHAMSDTFFAELDVPEPAHWLRVGSASHGAQTGMMLERIEQVLIAERPDVVLVYGDTNSTVAGAMAAVKLHVPVAHVEAGLRSLNRRMPEEINRVVTDHVSALLFAPTTPAVEHLRREGIPDDRVHLVGDVMYDLALLTAERLGDIACHLEQLGLPMHGFVLGTIHRAENTDDPERLRAIVTALRTLAMDRPVVVPMHPRTREAVERQRLDTGGTKIIDPVGYLEMSVLELGSAVVVTDSGGVQKEAYFHRRPCVTLRDETEWTELVDLGWNRVTPPTSAPVIVEAVEAAIGTTGRDASPYGDGQASARIAAAVAAGIDF